MLPDDDISFDREVLDRVHLIAKYLARKAGCTWQGEDDWEQELMLHLLQAMTNYDANQGEKNAFACGVLPRVVTQILRRQRRQKRYGPTVSLDALRALPDGEHYEPAVAPNTPEGNPDTCIYRAVDVAQVIAGLRADEQQLAHLLHQQKLADAARMLDVPSTTLQRTLDRLRQAFTDAGFGKE
jgi:DNA-directed RNA polymerase specialized sigma24 family protein